MVSIYLSETPLLNLCDIDGCRRLLTGFPYTAVRMAIPGTFGIAATHMHLENPGAGIERYLGVVRCGLINIQKFFKFHVLQHARRGTENLLRRRECGFDISRTGKYG